MRWIRKMPTEPREGEYRIVKKFALLPYRIDNEYRWLETMYILQQLNAYIDGCLMGRSLEWDDVEFASKYDNVFTATVKGHSK
jgi:hypothetical protein